MSDIGNQSTTYINVLTEYAKTASEIRNRRAQLNLSLTSWIGHVSFEDKITQVGFHQPPKNGVDAQLGSSENFSKLRIGSAIVKRENPNTVLIKATARYKPDDEDAYETDQWGYTETEYLPAFRITDLTKIEADLIEHFVPVAVEEASGFAGFRENATKTNSLVDRLKAIKLPDTDDVADELERYVETKERADELDAKIEKTDRLIDDIVYDLYDLNDDEIEIVESAVADD